MIKLDQGLTYGPSGMPKITPIAPKPVEGIPDGNDGKESFGDFLVKSVKNVNDLGLKGDQAIEDALAGKAVNPHSTIIALQRADISMRLMLAIKQKLEQSFQELMRTPLG